MASKAKPKQPLTTAQQLGSLIKSARDTMRKDKGLNGDLDRLPMLTWIMFLKFLDDLETIQEQKAKVAGKPYKPIIQPPYRWRDWAAKEEGITGEDLIRFINQQEAMRPDGKKGMGLFEYLRQLRGINGGRDQRDVIANIFRGVINRMTSGFLLREVINKVNGIHFSSSEEIHTLSHLYESMLKEMRDAAGDSGEFYTPRAVVRFMIEVLNPRLGETVLDPACGTGGFLVEAFTHLSKQAKTVRDRQILQNESIVGGEAKPLPFLLAQMNLLLHGVEAPNISPGNSLAVPLREIGDRDRVDVIATNPPFGGEEEKGIQGNFPEDKQTSETALLFLQLIMRKLRRTPKPGRAGVVVPDGVLFGDGVSARIKFELLQDFNLHTIVRLPKGVFAPYTDIPVNLLFFDRQGPTTEIWYYEQPLPDGRRNYTKTMPMRVEEFEGCLKWWNHRDQTERAWLVPVERVLRFDNQKRIVAVNLDQSNPNGASEWSHRSPAALVDEIIENERAVIHLLENVRSSLARLLSVEWKCAPTLMNELVSLRNIDTSVDRTVEYEFAGVYSFGRGVFRGMRKQGSEFSYERLTRLGKGDFLYPKLMAWEGALGIVPEECDGLFVSPEFPVFRVDSTRVLPEVLDVYFRSQSAWPKLAAASTGTNARRRRLHPSAFLALTFPLPPMEIQEEIKNVRLAIQSIARKRSGSESAVETLLTGFLSQHLVVTATESDAENREVGAKHWADRADPH